MNETTVSATYRLITAYLFVWVNYDKIMHMRWNFDASSAQTQRVNALDKHQNWRDSALFCHNSRAQSKYAVIYLLHTWHKQMFCVSLDVISMTLYSLKHHLILLTKYWYPCSKWINPMQRSCACKHCTRCLKLRIVQLYKSNSHSLLSSILSIVNSDWLQHVRSVRRVCEFVLLLFGEQTVLVRLEWILCSSV